MRRRRGAAPALHACLGLLLAGAMASGWSPAWGSLVFAASLAGALGSAAAIAILAATLVGSAIAWRCRYPTSATNRHAALATH